MWSLMPIWLWFASLGVTAILAYMQGHRDARMAFYETVLPMKALRNLHSQRSPSESWCQTHQQWYQGHCPDCTLPSQGVKAQSKNSRSRMSSTSTSTQENRSRLSPKS